MFVICRRCRKFCLLLDILMLLLIENQSLRSTSHSFTPTSGTTRGT